MFPNYPQRPNIPNPYQIVGQAVGDFAGNVQTFGREQDALQERFRQMMEKRAQAELAAKQRQEDLAFKQAEEARKQSEFEQKEKAEEAKQKFLQDFTGADPTDPANQLKLRQALTSGIIDKGVYDALQPKVPEYKEVGGGLYEIGPNGQPRQVIAPKPPAPDKPRLQQVTLDDGTLAVLNLDDGSYKPVNDPNGQPVRGGTRDQGGKVFQQENTLRDEFNKKTEPYEKALTAFDKMSRAIQSNNSADAYAAVIDFVKTLDPGSTVREGEYTTAKAASAGGTYGRLRQSIRNLYDGKMTPEVQKALLDAGRNLISAEKAAYDRTRADYKRRVENYNTRGINLDTNAVLSTYPGINEMIGSAPETRVYKGVTYELKPGANRKDPNSWVPKGKR